jgi:Flp pilus assembly protein TadG
VSVRSFLKDTRGSAAVEFGLTFPAFAAFTLMIFASGWAFHCAQSVRHELSEAGRSLQLNPALTAAQLQTQVRSGVHIGTTATSQITVTLVKDAEVAGTQLAHTTATFPLFLAVPFLEDLSPTYTVSVTVPLKAT